VDDPGDTSRKSVAEAPLTGLSLKGHRPENPPSKVDFMNALDQALFDKIKQLTPQRLAEVEDFVDFLRSRDDEQRLTYAAAKAGEASFAEVWDNDDDAAYDRM
jgi:hypothetical protein